MSDGLLYAVGGSGSGLSVFDVGNRKRPRRVGHFARGNDRIQAGALLPGGRLLLGGKHLYLFDEPQV